MGWRAWHGTPLSVPPPSVVTQPFSILPLLIGTLGDVWPSWATRNCQGQNFYAKISRYNFVKLNQDQRRLFGTSHSSKPSLDGEERLVVPHSCWNTFILGTFLLSPLWLCSAAFCSDLVEKGELGPFRPGTPSFTLFQSQAPEPCPSFSLSVWRLLWALRVLSELV